MSACLRQRLGRAVTSASFTHRLPVRAASVTSQYPHKSPKNSKNQVDDDEMQALLAMLRGSRTRRLPHARVLARAFHTNGSSTGDADQINRLLCEVRNQLGVAMIGAATAALDMDIRTTATSVMTEYRSSVSVTMTPSRAPTPTPENEVAPRKWQLFGQIGAGSFGIVHIGMCEDSGQVAAVKIVRPNKQTFSTLEREIKTLEFVRALGGHPNIINLYDLYVQDRAVYLVTELVRGGELYDYVAAQGALSENDARSMSKDIVEALRFLHHYGVVHRDVKPENILLTHRSSKRAATPAPVTPHVKLADFGSAGPTNAELRMDEVGTSAYLPPEVFRDGVCTTACDMWALGCVLYISLSGAHPFDLDGTATDSEVELRAKRMPVTFDFAPWQDVSADAKDLIRWLLEKDPNDRPTAEQVLTHPWMAGREPPTKVTIHII